MEDFTNIGRRLFASEYSSSGQRNWAAKNTDTWSTEMLAQLRFDTIAAHRVVIPDTHLFDGTFFMSLSPQDLAADIGTMPGTKRRALELRLRQGTTKATLAHLLIKEGSDNLNAFPFKLIPDEKVRTKVATALGQTPRSRWESLMTRCDGNPARALAELLRDCLRSVEVPVDKQQETLEVIDRAERGWALWSESADTTFPTRPWRGKYDLQAAVANERLDADLTTGEGMKLYLEARAFVRGGSSHRSDLSTRVGELKAATTDQSLLRDLNIISGWYSKARYRAIANQHQCAFSFNADLVDGARPEDHPYGIARQVEHSDAPSAAMISLPESFQESLMAASGNQFGEALAAATRNLEPWWRRGDRAALDRGVETLLDRLKCSGPTPRQSRVQKYVAIGTPLVVAAEASRHGFDFKYVLAIVGGVMGISVVAAEGVRRQLQRNRIIEALQRRVAIVAA